MSYDYKPCTRAMTPSSILKIKRFLHKNKKGLRRSIESKEGNIYFYAFQKYFLIRRGRMFRFLEDPHSDVEGPVRGYLINYNPTNGDVIVDVGAYRGHFSVLMAKEVGSNGKVVAIEPDPINAERLLENLRINRIDNVIIINKGLWDKKTKLELTICSDRSTFVENQFINKADDVKKHVVEVDRGDEILKSIGIQEMDFLKMDIEGAELEALLGLGDYLSSDNLKVAVASYHEVGGETTSGRVEEILKSFGHKTYTGFPSHLTTYGVREKSEN